MYDHDIAGELLKEPQCLYSTHRSLVKTRVLLDAGGVGRTTTKLAGCYPPSVINPPLLFLPSTILSSGPMSTSATGLDVDVDDVLDLAGGTTPPQLATLLHHQFLPPSHPNLPPSFYHPPPHLQETVTCCLSMLHVWPALDALANFSSPPSYFFPHPPDAAFTNSNNRKGFEGRLLRARCPRVCQCFQQLARSSRLH